MALNRLSQFYAVTLLAAVSNSAFAQENPDPGNVAACLPRATKRPRVSVAQACQAFGSADLRADLTPTVTNLEISTHWAKSRPKSLLSRSESAAELWKEFDERKIPESELVQELARLERLQYAKAAVQDPNGKILTPELLLTHAEKIRQDLGQLVQAEPGTSRASKQALTEALTGVKFFTYAAAAQTTDLDERRIMLSTLRDRCGVSMSDASAEYLHREPKKIRSIAREIPQFQLPALAELKPISAVIICPRHLGLVRSAQVPLFSHLQWTISHELGHGMTILAGTDTDSDEFTKTRRLSQASLLIHAPYLTCMQKEFGSEIPSLEELHMQTLLIEELNRVQQEILSQIRAQERNARNDLAWTPLGIESHAKELVADYWAARWVARYGIAASKSASQLSTVLGGTLAHFCFQEKALPRIDGIPHGEEGVHPSNAVRVNVILSQPEVQRAMRRARVPLPDLPPPCGL